MQFNGRKSHMAQQPRYSTDKIVACRKKEGQWDDETGICVLPDNKISMREEAIENAAYRICDTKYNYGEYNDIVGCFQKEGYARIDNMLNRPHLASFLDPKIIKLKLWLGTWPNFEGWKPKKKERK